MVMVILTCTLIGIVITISWYVIDWFLIDGWVRKKTDDLSRDYTMQAMADMPAAPA